MKLRSPLAEMTRYLLYPLIMLAMLLTLSGCGDNEPEQRKAFIDFLQTRVLAKTELAVPALTDKEKASFGPYLHDYQVLAGYHQQMNQIFNASLGPVFTHLSSIGSVSSLMAKRDEMTKMTADSEAWKPALTKVRADTDSKHAALTQPDDLKAVYDQAYSKLIVQPDAVAQQIATLVPQVLSLVVEQVDLLKAQGDTVQITGNQVQFRDPKALEQYNAIQQQLQPLATELMKTAVKLQHMMY